MNKNMTISLGIGGLIAVVTLYFAFRNVPFGELIAYLGSVNYLLLIPAIALVYLSFIGRVLRWRTILNVSTPISFSKAYHPLMIGFMLNCVLPARAGELGRAVILQQKEKVPFVTGLATIAAERIFDLLILISLFTVVMGTVHIDPAFEMHFGDYVLNRALLMTVGANMVKLSVVLMAGMLFISIEKGRRLIRGAIFLIPKLVGTISSKGAEKVTQKLCRPMIRMMENVATGFILVKDVKKLLLCVGLSLFVWGIQTVSWYVTALACPGIPHDPAQIAAVMVILCFTIALPSVPGFWGLWEAGTVFGASLFAVSAKDAAGFALTSHAVQMFPVILIGLVSALHYGIKIKQISPQKVPG